MARFRKALDECSQVRVNLCGEIKKRVLDRIELEKEKSKRVISRELAIQYLILGK